MNITTKLARRRYVRPSTPFQGTDRGQTTAEYALVLLAAGTIAMLVVAWADSNGVVGDFFDQVFERITSLVA